MQRADNPPERVFSLQDQFYPTALAGTARLREYYSGARLSRRATALALYGVLNELAFRSYSPMQRFSTVTPTIAEMLGIGVATMRGYLREFREIGLLYTEFRKDATGKVNLPSIHHLLRVAPSAAELPAAPPPVVVYQRPRQDAPPPPPAPPEPPPAPLAAPEAPTDTESRLAQLRRLYGVPMHRLAQIAAPFWQDGEIADWAGLQAACFDYREAQRR